MLPLVTSQDYNTGHSGKSQTPRFKNIKNLVIFHEYLSLDKEPPDLLEISHDGAISDIKNSHRKAKIEMQSILH